MSPAHLPDVGPASRRASGGGTFGTVSTNHETHPDHPHEPTRHDRLGEKLPIRMLHDRVLVRIEGAEGERRSTGGILIPATAELSKRCTWAEAVAVGQSVRSVEPGDRVLYDPEDKLEVEVRGATYVLLRERDLHAVAATRFGDTEGSTGLYL
ncbi:chaperonin GroES [Streptomyces sp. 1331.2]|nr:chaperonin GroES [Streptomyces sp. 1331.2]